MPHGGYKQSGYGKNLSIYALEDHTQIKHVMAKIDQDGALGNSHCGAEDRSGVGGERAQGNAIGFVDALVNGPASTAPAYEAEVELVSERPVPGSPPLGRAGGRG